MKEQKLEELVEVMNKRPRTPDELLEFLSLAGNSLLNPLGKEIVKVLPKMNQKELFEFAKKAGCDVITNHIIGNHMLTKKLVRILVEDVYKFRSSNVTKCAIESGYLDEPEIIRSLKVSRAEEYVRAAWNRNSIMRIYMTNNLPSTREKYYKELFEVAGFDKFKTSMLKKIQIHIGTGNQLSHKIDSILLERLK